MASNREIEIDDYEPMNLVPMRMLKEESASIKSDTKTKFAFTKGKRSPPCKPKKKPNSMPQTPQSPFVQSPTSSLKSNSQSDIRTPSSPTCKSLSSSSVAASNSSDSDDDYQPYDFSKGQCEVTALELVANYSQSLPLQVEVTKGIYGMTDRYTLSTSDRYNIHMIRHRDLVRIEDLTTKAQYSIPVNSAIKFAPFYDPHFNETEARRGLIFPKVSDLLKMRRHPKAIIATQAWPGSSTCSSLVANEVLTTTEVIMRNGDDPEDNVSKIKVYSFTCDCMKTLDENCEGHFSTRPEKLQFYVSEILDNIQRIFPLRIVLFAPDDKITATFPKELFSNVHFLWKRFTDVTLLAASVTPEGGDDVEVVEIPTDLDVDFGIVVLSEAEKQKVVAETQLLSEKLNESDIRHISYINIPQELYEAQSKIYHVLRKGTSNLSLKAVTSSKADNDYSEPSVGNRLGIEHRVRMLEKLLDQVSHKEQQHTTSSSDQLTDSKLAEQAHELDKARVQIVGLQDEVAKLQRQLSSPTCAKKTFNPSENTIENKHILATLSMEQILSLMACAGMQQYEEIFRREGITGELLLECDEDVLEKELHVTSKIHRVKLMKLIHGIHSPQMYL